MSLKKYFRLLEHLKANLKITFLCNFYPLKTVTSLNNNKA